ncbi:MAG: RAD55 family ATPase [Candidatus Heimdallarchaeaceae archaeon]
MQQQNFRIKSGIKGLDLLFNGGFIKNSVISVVGGSGTGKTTMALKYIHQGLIDGDHILYISFEEEPTKLIEEAASLGIKFDSLIENPSDIIHLVESDRLVEFMTTILPALAKKLKSNKVKHTRIVIDPLTPLLWEFQSEREQRKVLTKAYYYLRSLGTVLQTIEETNAFGSGNLNTTEIRVPIYLSDSTIHIQNLGLGGDFNRTCKVVKSRKTKHYEGLFPLYFSYGEGIVIDTSSIMKQNDIKPSNEKILDIINGQLVEWGKGSDPKKKVIAKLAKKILTEENDINSTIKYEIIQRLVSIH